MTTIDTGDEVLHEPSREEWLVAAVDGDRLYWCGYPFGGSAPVSSCTLTRKATPERRDWLLKELANSPGSERPVILARQRLKPSDQPGEFTKIAREDELGDLLRDAEAKIQRLEDWQTEACHYIRHGLHLEPEECGCDECRVGLAILGRAKA